MQGVNTTKSAKFQQKAFEKSRCRKVGTFTRSFFLGVSMQFDCTEQTKIFKYENFHVNMETHQLIRGDVSECRVFNLKRSYLSHAQLTPAQSGIS